MTHTIPLRAIFDFQDFPGRQKQYLTFTIFLEAAKIFEFQHFPGGKKTIFDFRYCPRRQKTIFFHHPSWKPQKYLVFRILLETWSNIWLSPSSWKPQKYLKLSIYPGGQKNNIWHLALSQKTKNNNWLSASSWKPKNIWISAFSWRTKNNIWLLALSQKTKTKNLTLSIFLEATQIFEFQHFPGGQNTLCDFRNCPRRQKTIFDFQHFPGGPKSFDFQQYPGGQKKQYSTFSIFFVVGVCGNLATCVVILSNENLRSESPPIFHWTRFPKNLRWHT